MEHGSPESFQQISRETVRKDLDSNAFGLLNGNIERQNAKAKAFAFLKENYFLSEILCLLGCVSQIRRVAQGRGEGKSQAGVTGDHRTTAFTGSQRVLSTAARAGLQALGAPYPRKIRF